MHDDGSTIRDAFPEEVPTAWLPSRHQYKLWRKWLDDDLIADPDGYFLGKCPVHALRGDEVIAMFNFDAGVMRCLGDPSCHDPRRRCMSLTRVVTMMADMHHG